MSQLPQPSNSGLSSEDTVYQAPKVTLLTEKQWVYLEKRYRMTTREVEIARLICQGFINEEIAAKLNISPGTVKTHIRNIYRKTWARNKISMLLTFIEEVNSQFSGPRSFPAS